MELNLLEQKNMMIESAKIGVQLALDKFGTLKDQISQREAYRLWSETRVKKWVSDGLITPIKKGVLNSKVTYSRSEMETLHFLETNN
ncbi:MAG: hypothetical protein WCI92_16820 [Bacteroidota bacterium]